MPVTNGDRVLIHLLNRVSAEGWVGGVSDQDMISTLCGIGRTHVPRVLKPLLEQDLVIEKTGRSPGRIRRVKVYSLSEKGAAVADEAVQRAVRLPVRFTDDDNVIMEDEAIRVLSTINKRLSRLSMASIPLTLFLSLSLNDIRWNDILWIAASLGRDDKGSIPLPHGWRFHDHGGLESGNLFPNSILSKMDSLLKEKGLLLVKGPESSACNELIRTFLVSRKRKALWLVKGNSDNEYIDIGYQDVLVLLGGGDPDIESLLKDKGSVRDIRDDDWPKELKNMDLILTTSADMDVEGPLVEVNGISESFFLEYLEERGFNEHLSREIYKAFKGSPDILYHVDKMSKERIEKILEMDDEEAIFALLARRRQ